MMKIFIARDGGFEISIYDKMPVWNSIASGYFNSTKDGSFATVEDIGLEWLNCGEVWEFEGKKIERMEGVDE